MQRILIIGCSGAGKSTLARRIGEITGIEVFHLDQYYWKPNWEETSPSEWKGIVEVLAKKPRWIIDGNFGGTMDVRLTRADTIIYLNYSTLTCLWRVTKRILKYWGKVRPDMTTGCRERFDFEFYHYVATFNLTRRKKLLERLSKHHEKQIHILKNDRAIQNFLKSTGLHGNRAI